MFAFTILGTYVLATLVLLTSASAAQATTMSHNEPSGKALQADRILTGLLGVMIVLHGASLVGDVILENTQGLGFADVLSVIAWLLAAIGLYAMMQPGFRAVSGVVLAISALLVGACLIIGGDTAAPLSWQIKLHAILSLVAYSFLGAGSVLATASLMQDSQLRAARVGRLSTILPPLIATEQFLARLTIAGFVFLLLAVTSGFIFVDNMFAQHLTHKSVLSIAGLVIFGALVVGRQVAGWRGRRMLFFYLAGFGVLLLAYFGSKVILEVVLNRHWG